MLHGENTGRYDMTPGYFDIDIDMSDLLSQYNTGVDEVFYLRDLAQRKLYLMDDISQLSIGTIVKYILQYNAEDAPIPPKNRKPILLYLVSNGGDVDSGFELIDAIMASKTPVYTINLGYQYSMGFMIGIAGHKRFAMPNAKFLIHDGSNFIYNSGAKAQDQMEFNKRVEERVKKLILNSGKIEEEEYENKKRVEWYMFADEAKEKGFVDYIIGEDCSIDDIV